MSLAARRTQGRLASSAHAQPQLHAALPRRCRCQASSAASPSSSQKSKGWDRPWIAGPNANAPAMAPRNSGDPFGVLMSRRTIFMGGEVEDVMADALVGQLLMLDKEEQGKDIKLFINSPGGSVTAGLGIYDAMMLCRSDVSTYCFGLAASMGAFLLGAGKKGKRYSMPNSRIMIHQPLGGASGQAVDMEIQAKEILYHKGNLNRIIAEYTGQSLNQVEQDTDRDNYMNPIEARDYGIIDHIVGGEEAVYRVKGSLRKFPKVKEEFIHDLDDLVKRNIMDGDPFYGPTPSHRFKSRETEPYMPSQARGNPWFKVKRISKEEYKELLELNRPDSDSADGKRSPKEKIDSAW